MKSLGYFLAAVLCILPATLLSAQEEVSPLIFDAYECDFGEVEESGGTLFQTFHFINGAATPVRILRVSASCTCVSVSYPQGRLAGGETGEISVAFNPARTVGDVIRMVDIFMSDGLPGVSLTLKAHVIPSDYDIEDVYSIALPDGIRVTSLSQRFGYVTSGQMAERRIDVINSSSSPVTLGAEPAAAGSALSVACPERLGPGEAGSIILRYTLPGGAAAYGLHSDSVTLLVNGRPCNRTLEVSCIGIAELGARTGNVPNMQVYPSRPQMKKSLLGRGRSGSFEIRNTGRAELHILKVDLPEGASCDLPDGAVVKPGGSRKVKLSSGSSDFTFGLVTDDPLRPYKEIRTNSN